MLQCGRALVKAWAGLGREEGGGPSALFPRAWASTQSNYQNQLKVSYLPATQCAPHPLSPLSCPADLPNAWEGDGACCARRA